MISFKILDAITFLLRIGKKRCSLLFTPSPSCNRLFHCDRWRLVRAIGLVAPVFTTFHRSIPVLLLGLLDNLRILASVFAMAVDTAQLLVVLSGLYGKRAIIVLLKLLTFLTLRLIFMHFSVLYLFMISLLSAQILIFSLVM